MAAPRVLIENLPEQPVPEPADLLVVQNGAITKKMLVGALTTLTSAPIDEHITDDSGAHAASSISAQPNAAPMTGTDVQTQLSQIAAELIAVRESEHIEVGPIPPSDTEWLWADTNEEGSDLSGPGINVRDYGAVGDGVADDSAAFIAVMEIAKARIMWIDGPFSETNRRGTVKIVIPAGVYRITQPEAFMTRAPIRTAGLMFEGDGESVTNIWFDPPSPASEVFLCTNTEEPATAQGWLDVTFKDMTFNAHEANASFMFSQADGGPQHYTFRNVQWNGEWKRGIVLEGKNNNDQMGWYHCSMLGNFETFFDMSPSNEPGADNFVDYNFYASRIWMYSGTFVKATRGGSINFFGGSIMLMGDGSADLLFADLIGDNHYLGMARFQLNGIRVELLHERAKIIRCSWPYGNVLISNCDFSAHVFNNELASFISAEFNPGGYAGPVVAWRDCWLQGRHRYTYGSNTFTKDVRVLYEGCTFQAEVTDCILINAEDAYTSNDARGGKAQVDIRNCRLDGSPRRQPVDQRLNWQTTLAGAPQVRYCQVLNYQGQIPSMYITAEPVKLPLGSVITALHGWKPVSTSSGYATFTYTFKNGDDLTLGVIKGDGTTPFSQGFEDHVRDLWFVCDTDAKRTISVTPFDIDQTADGVMMIEYLA